MVKVGCGVQPATALVAFDAPRRRGHRSDLRELRQGLQRHDACRPIGVRWIEPVLQGTNPVIVHPNALGEAEMAARTIKVLRLG